jgi:hypothetical protein
MDLSRLAVSVLALSVWGCGAADPFRGCKLCVASGVLPGLERQADPGSPKLDAKPHCAVVATPGLPDEPESADDLDSILGTGLICGPDGKAQAVPECPALAERGWKASKPVPSGTPPICGELAAMCPNQKVVLEREDEDPLELEFYDDPSFHRPPSRAVCPVDNAKLHICYYRLGQARVLVRL